MPGIPLLNLGVGLGGLTQGFNQARQQGMQQQLQQIALQQYLSQQNASRLAGLGLQAGLLNPDGSGASLPTGGGGSQPLPTVAQAPPPPPPGAASQPAAPAPPQTGDITVTPAGPGAAQPNPGTQYFGAVGGSMAGDDTPSWAKGVGGATSMTGEGAPDVKAGPQVTETPDTKPAPGPGPDTGSAPPPPVESHVSVALPGGQQLGVPDLFRVLDTTKVAQGLARLAPHADPADIYQATADLLKLSNGNKNEQLQAAYLAKLMGINLQVQGRHEDTQTRAAATERGQDITARGQDIRASTAATTQNRIDRRQQIAIDARAAAAQKKAQDTGQGAIAKQISAIRGQMAAIKPADGVTYDDKQQAQLAALAQQLAAITSRLEQFIPPQK